MSDFMSMDDYKGMQKGLNESLKKAAKGSDSKILKETVSEIDREDDPDVKKRCSLLHRIFDEGIDMYECGDMTFEEMKEDMYKAFKEIE